MPQFLVAVMEIIKSRVNTNARVNRDTRTERERNGSMSCQGSLPPLRVQVSSSVAELLAIRATMEGKKQVWGPSVGVRSHCYCQYIFNKKEGRMQFSRCWRQVKPAAASAAPLLFL